MLIRRIYNTVRALCLELWRFKKSPIKAIRNWLAAYGNEFSPIEIRRYGLADPIHGSSLQNIYISKEKADRFYYKYNLKEDIPLIADKVLFEERCKSKNFPIPQTYGTYLDGKITSSDGALIKNDVGIKSFLAEKLRNPCIFKPNDGGVGRNMAVAHYHAENEVELNEEVLNWDNFVQRLNSLTTDSEEMDKYTENTYRGMMIQKRIINHDMIANLSGYDMLQTVRICTYVTPEKNVEILFCFFKLAGQEGLADAFNLGKTGNMIADVDIETGALKSVYTMKGEHDYFRKIKKHPKTGQSFNELLLPYWEECKDLATKLALEFLPLGAVGWDIAITNDGPIVLEGNENWVPVVPAQISNAKLKEYGLN